jgi:ABC-type antimicrobial peptide transport system permease subunit
MNLSTARSEKRSKEVGIRKTVGSVRAQLVAQFFSESFLVVMISFIASTLIVYVSLPWFNELSAKEMTLPVAEKWFWIISIAFIVFTGFVAGSYPALYLSSFNPVSVLKGVIRPGRFASLPRKVLVISQFAVSVILIIFTTAIYEQLLFVKQRPVGYEREGLIMMRKKSEDFDTKAEVLRTELKKTGVVAEVAESGGELTGTWSHNIGFNWEGKDPAFEASFATLNVSPEFGKTVGWNFIEGRDFSPHIASDSAAIILNEAAAAYMKLKNPVGKTIRWTNRAWNVDQDFKIVGVIKDMIMNSPFDPVKPAIYLTYGYERVLLIRISPGLSPGEALPKIERVFAQVIPAIPFEYKFADEEFAAKFSNEERIGKLAAIFASLAIVISCLGLFGLVSFVAEQRTKEIGIRKVLGASVGNLWRMLSQEFVVLVVLSCGVAILLSYYILDKVISSYEYRTELGWWTFASAAIGAVIIALATVSFQAIRAALRNPVKSITTE